MTTDHPSAADIRLAIVLESLYLGNLLLAPVLAYAAILWIASRRRTEAYPLAACHQAQVVRAGLLGALLPLLAVGIIFALGGFVSLTAWVVAEVYIIFIHTPLILLGLAGLLKAMAGKPYVFPLIGQRC